jgi:hypothetical protein
MDRTRDLGFGSMLPPARQLRASIDHREGDKRVLQHGRCISIGHRYERDGPSYPRSFIVVLLLGAIHKR